MSGAPEDGEAHAQVVPHEIALPTQPAPDLRLQHEEALPIGQHDMDRANSGWMGAPKEAQNATSARTAIGMRPLNAAILQPPRRASNREAPDYSGRNDGT
jgi:hypothetical protein